MRITRSILVAVAVILSAVIEATWLSPIGLPGATPPLTLVLVLSLSMRRTPQAAALLGFFAGIVVDIVPPSTSPLGISAFAFTLVAYLMSMARPFYEGAVILPLATAPVAAFTSLLTRLLVGAIVGAPVALADAAWLVLLTTVLYALILATFVFPVTAWIDRMITPRTSPIFG